MQASRYFSLGEIVNTSILQEIQDKFSEATGLSSVIVDTEGNPLTTPSNFTCFCNYLRANDEGLNRCMACDDTGGRRAWESKKPMIYRCHSGLTDLAAPIIVQNQYIGAFLAGQVVIAEDKDEIKEDMLRRVDNLQLDSSVLSELFDKVEVVPENRIKAAAELIYIMSNYIVEIGVANIAQKLLMSEMKAKADLENLLRAAELKALQSQVNPHFLFNTLNTIARMALLEGASQTQEVVYALSDLLRNNLSDVDKMRKLEEEIKSIQDYLVIQKKRFGDRIRAVIEIQPEIMQTNIPALTLQPLVENSIIHGLEGKSDGGCVYIRGHKENGKVYIEVSDTGIGLSQEQINNIFRKEKRTVTQGQTTGLGILNVHKRIQHFFGEEYGLTMEGAPGKGTKVSIQLPYLTN